MDNSPKLDLQNLHAFVVVAHELNMRHAAELLHIAQPPLSRKIRQIEDNLGITLFKRHCRGLELTGEGREVLALIQPLLAHARELECKLNELAKNKTEHYAIGLTTAFEQGIFNRLTQVLKSDFGDSLSITRASSPSLIRAIAKGGLLAAWVAIPIDIQGLALVRANYAEPLLVALPVAWKIAEKDLPSLRVLNDKPFFWFAKGRNPVWHAHMHGIFRQIGFKPKIIEEPEEHDVLLARIAAGEGFALMPSSFAEITREGVVFRNVGYLPPLELGFAYNPNCADQFARYASFAQ